MQHWTEMGKALQTDTRKSLDQAFCYIDNMLYDILG